jgi:hypothetical protein
MSVFENDPTPVVAPEPCRQPERIAEQPKATGLPDTDEAPTRPAADPLGAYEVPIPSESADLRETREQPSDGGASSRRVIALVLAAIAGAVAATGAFFAGAAYQRYSTAREHPRPRMEWALGFCQPERALNLAIHVEEGRVRQAHVDARPTPGSRCVGRQLQGLDLGQELEGFSRWRVSVTDGRVRLTLLDGPKP